MQAADAEATDILDVPALQPFQQQGFNSTEFASRILKDPKQSSKERTRELRDHVNDLDAAIRDEVVSKQDELLAQARQLAVSKASLAKIKTSIAGLREKSQRLRREVAQPLDVVQKQVTQLTNLRKAMEALRVVTHRVKQTGKLQQLMSTGEKLDAMNMARAAKIVWEIESGAPAELVAEITAVSRCGPSCTLAPSHTITVSP